MKHNLSTYFISPAMGLKEALAKFTNGNATTTGNATTATLTTSANSNVVTYLVGANGMLVQEKPDAVLEVFTKDFINTYLASVEYPLEEVGDFFYFLYNDTLPKYKTAAFEAHPDFVAKYTPEVGKVMFKFRIPADVKSTIVDPFLDGKYSQVDRTYVDTHFPNDASNKNYTTRQVFEKHPAMRAYQEDRTGVELPPDAEVWDKVKTENETYIPAYYKMDDSPADLNAETDPH